MVVEHVNVELLIAVTFCGLGVTSTNTVVVAIHPPLSPIKVYVVATVGDTIEILPVVFCGIQVYDVVPLPVKVAVEPAQTKVGLATAVTVGPGVTVMTTVDDVIHPEPLSASTVYVVVVVGVTITLAPVKAPGFQVYEVAPLALNGPDDPSRNKVGAATTVTDGAPTLIVIVCVDEHDPLSPVTV